MDSWKDLCPPSEKRKHPGQSEQTPEEREEEVGRVKSPCTGPVRQVSAAPCWVGECSLAGPEPLPLPAPGELVLGCCTVRDRPGGLVETVFRLIYKKLMTPLLLCHD